VLTPKPTIQERSKTPTFKPSISVKPSKPSLRPTPSPKPQNLSPKPIFSANPLIPSLKPSIENSPITTSTRPTFSRDICRKKVDEMSKGFNYSLSFEIVSSSRNVSYMRFGELFTECAPPISEFLAQYQMAIKDIAKILKIYEGHRDDVYCETSKNCTTQETLCVATKCVDLGRPLFALQWKGSDKYNLRVRAPDGTALTAETSISSFSNVKIVKFPSSGGPYGTYIIDVWNSDLQIAVLSPWELFAFPGINGTTVLLQYGTSSKRNIFYEYKRL
jgi:hypothetical protein